MMKVTLVMASGKEVVFQCASAKTQSSRMDNTLASVTLEGVKGQNFLFVKLANVDVVLFEEEETSK